MPALHQIVRVDDNERALLTSIKTKVLDGPLRMPGEVQLIPNEGAQ